MPDPPYEVLAIRYGYVDSSRRENFYRYHAYGEPDAPYQLDCFFWVIRNEAETILVDTGFNPQVLEHRPGRHCTIDPLDALAELGIDPEEIGTIIVTHFHYDHIGNLSRFPNARFVAQEREAAFWFGPHGACPAAAITTEPSEIPFLRDALRDGRLDLIEGDAPLAPGVHAILTSGHSPGQMMVMIDDGPTIVLTSDALHHYEEGERQMPIEIFFDLEAMLTAYDRIRDLEVSRGALIVAGHDPLVMARFPALDDEHPELGVRIDGGRRARAG